MRICLRHLHRNSEVYVWTSDAVCSVTCLDYNVQWTASAVRPLCCRLVRVMCLFYPFNLRFFWGNDPWTENRKYGTRIHVTVVAKFGRKIGRWEVANRLSRFPDKKIPANLLRGPRPSPLVCLHLAGRSRPKFPEVNVISPWPMVHVNHIWVRIGCRSYSRKIDFSDPH